MTPIANNTEYKKLELLETDLYHLQDVLSDLEHYGLSLGEELDDKIQDAINTIFI